MNRNYHKNRRFYQIASILLVGLLASGCSFGGGKNKLSANAPIVSNAVSKPVKAAGVVNEDAQVITDAVATATVKPASTALAWANPNTGSSGTIVAIENFVGKHGQKCRGFKTTVSTFMGIAFYDGEACQISPGEWVLSWFKPQDSNKSG